MKLIMKIKMLPNLNPCQLNASLSLSKFFHSRSLQVEVYTHGGSGGTVTIVFVGTWAMELLIQ